tara:strand:- start:302 stop:523 length:222 start_codon:yes stop_codon:yes gene_type:complete
MNSTKKELEIVNKEIEKQRGEFDSQRNIMGEYDIERYKIESIYNVMLEREKKRMLVDMFEREKLTFEQFRILF